MEIPEGIDAVDDLKKARAEGEAARRQRLMGIEILDEMDLVERTSTLLARKSQ